MLSDIKKHLEDIKMELVFGIVLLAMALFLVVAVAAQSGKEKGLGGTISGGMDTGFGGKAARDRKLGLLTAIVSVVFVLVVVVMYIVVS